MEVHQLPMNLRSVVESAIKPLIIDCEAKQLDLNWSIAAEFPEHVISDGACIRQIILNLVGNAVKFTERGSIDITVTGTSEEIRLAVRDTGIGISDNEREQIFSPFVQASSASQTRVGGSGLGLSIVYRLVKLLGGSIEVESEVAVGSTFTVYLPIQPCSEAQVTKSIGQTTVAEDEWQHEDLNVLLADDNLINRTVANKMLQQLGCRVMEATDGHEAIALIEQNEFDLVLMDVQMPNMDGLTATGKIRQMEGQLSDLIIVGLSANAMPGDEARMLDAGMNACLSKPVRLEKLREALSLA